MSRAGVGAALGSLFAVVGSLIAWQEEPVSSTREASVVDGAGVFLIKGCSSCHNGPDTIAPSGLQFPSLAEVPAWAGNRRAGMKAKEYVFESVRDPGAFISPALSGGSGPGGVMPDLGLSNLEADAVVEYLLLGR